MAHSDDVRSAALKLLQDIRDAEYAQFLRADPGDEGTESGTDSASHSDRAWTRSGRASSRTFTGSPILSVEVGEVRIDEESRPCVPYRLELSGGGVLAGNLTFEYVDLGQGGRWCPIEDIDWFIDGGAP